MFQFIANPVGSHLLAKAAKLDNCPVWEGQIADEEHDPVSE
jgi:multisubunit Na+/H+ antiporter MnhG subunit